MDLRKEIKRKCQDVAAFEEKWQFADAINICIELCALSKKHYGTPSQEYENHLNKLAELYYRAGEPENSAKTQKKVLRIIKKLKGEHHLDFARGLRQLAIVQNALGNYHDAEKSFLKVLKLLKKVDRNNREVYAYTLGGLAVLYHAIGDFRSAELFHDESTQMMLEIYGDDSEHIARAFNNRANLYTAMGDYEAAERLYKKVKNIWSKYRDPDDPEIAMLLSNIGEMKHQAANYIDSEKMLKKSLEIYKKSLDYKHPSYANCLTRLGSLYLDTGRYKDAVDVLEIADEIWREKLGDENVHHAFSLNYLAEAYYSIGDLVSAENTFQKCITIRENILVNDSPELADSLYNYGLILASTDRLNEALKKMNAANNIHDEVIRRVFKVSSDNNRFKYLVKLNEYYDIYLSLIHHIQTSGSNAAKLGLDFLLKRKALILDASKIQREITLSGKYPDLAKKLHKIIDLKTRIANLLLSSSGTDKKDFNKLLDELHLKKEKLESELAKKIPEIEFDLKIKSADRVAISSLISKDSVLIEYIRYDLIDFTTIPIKSSNKRKSPRYAAFIMKAEEPERIEYVDLGPAEIIDSLISKYRFEVTGSFDENTRGVSIFEKKKTTKMKAGKALRKIIFDKLTPFIMGKTKLLISPDDELCKVPIETLPISKGKYLLDEFSISYLSVGRDVLRFQSDKSINYKKDIVIADPDFDLNDTPDQVSSTAEPTKHRSFTTKFERIPGTRVEGLEISSKLNTKPWLGDRVNKTSVKAIKSPRILHIATHGFFMESRDGISGNTDSIRIDNPLLRSGLVLAGANKFLQNGSPCGVFEDGLLTAEDVSGLDLFDTEIVVLSACNTGLGEVYSGEGVLGLRRSFALAGAKSLIMSLWKIPDIVTPILMGRFYDNLINQGLGKGEALREAQIYIRDIKIIEIRKWFTKEMTDNLSANNEETRNEILSLLEKPDDICPFKDPYYWGAFICQGDPGPILTKNKI